VFRKSTSGQHLRGPSASTSTAGAGGGTTPGGAGTLGAAVLSGRPPAGAATRALESSPATAARSPPKGELRARSRHAGHGAHAARPGRALRADPGGGGDGRRGPRPRRGGAAPGGRPAHGFAGATPLGGWGPCRAAGGVGQSPAAATAAPPGNREAFRRPPGGGGQPQPLVWGAPSGGSRAPGACVKRTTCCRKPLTRLYT
jgi:hypothetical protein